MRRGLSGYVATEPTLVVALDFSLTATGYATSTGKVGTISAPEALGLGHERVKYIRDCVLSLASNAGLVIVEGYAYGANDPGARAVAEMRGVVRFALEGYGRKIVEVPPPTLKKFATGKGTAKKEDVLVAAVKRLNYAGSDNNQSDALWLLEMARTWLAGDASNEHQRSTIKAVKWPKLEGGA